MCYQYSEEPCLYYTNRDIEAGALNFLNTQIEIAPEKAAKMLNYYDNFVTVSADHWNGPGVNVTRAEAGNFQIEVMPGARLC